jgi:hypothetical protein
MTTLTRLEQIGKGRQSRLQLGAALNLTKSKRHRSPLHKLAYEFKLNPTQMEKIQPIRH